MTWEKFRDGLLGNADSTAEVSAHFKAVAEDVAAERWKWNDFIDEAIADDPGILALLKRNIAAHEAMAAGLKELRAAIMAAAAARKVNGE